MFDVSFAELLLLSAVVLLVVGPERLPEVVRACGRLVQRTQRLVRQMQFELEQHIGVNEFRQDTHNQEVLRRLEQEEKKGEAPGKKP